MLQMNDHDERTETPTRKRLEDARMNGQAALSQDLVGSVVLGVGAGSVLLFSGSIFSAFLTITRTSLGNFGSLRLNTEAASGLVQRTLEQILQIISNA
jgi:flagellar biosynthesis protein FlhB